MVGSGTMLTNANERAGVGVSDKKWLIFCLLLMKAFTFECELSTFSAKEELGSLIRRE